MCFRAVRRPEEKGLSLFLTALVGKPVHPFQTKNNLVLAARFTTSLVQRGLPDPGDMCIFSSMLSFSKYGDIVTLRFARLGYPISLLLTNTNYTGVAEGMLLKL